jgi:APA family basic amino acid/polyamine antiporter
MSHLKRTFNKWSSVSIVVGGIIGSAIFMKPALMASQLGSPWLLIAVWIGAGIITLFGALSNAEVAAMIPETGGQYIFFQKMYGPFVAFLYGWAAFAVFNTAGVASIAYVFGTYVQYFVALPRLSAVQEHTMDLYIPFLGHIFPFENIGVKGVTIFVVLVLTFVNYRSTRIGGNVLVLFTTLKVAALVLIVFGTLFSGKGSATHFFTTDVALQPHGWALVGALVAATSGAFWGYDGWNNITFVAGEIRNPQVNIPRSLLIGLLACIGIYSAITLAYLYVLPISAVAASPLVAADAAQVVLGSTGGAIITLLVVVSTFGTTHGNILATARVSFAMAREKQFFEAVGRIHPRFGTPGNALLLHGTWTAVLVLSGSFDTLTDMLIFVSWLFYGLSALGVFILRKKMPDAPRPYRVWGYPYVPALFVLFTAAYLVATLINDINAYLDGRAVIVNSVLGIALTMLGLPLYGYYQHRRNQKSARSR